MDVQKHYERSSIVICLKTKSKPSALRASKSIASKLVDFWFKMRLAELDVPASHLLIKGKPKEAFTSYAPKLSEALSKYCSLKGQGRAALFFKAGKRNVSYVIDHLGDRPIDTYTSADAASFRDWLIARGLNVSSIARIFGTVKAVVNLTIQELGLDCSNAFLNIYLPKKEEEKRKPLRVDEIMLIQKTCLEIADERRLLLALISDIGMRLSEAAGLHKGDIILDAPVPYLNLQPHSWRRLKTKGSARHIPLIGVSLWAARRIHRNDSSYAFPRYCDETGCKANSASGGLNKWLHQYVPDNCVIHSFRHSLRDRLRAVECPSDIVDALGGWKTSGVGHGYGNGSPLDVLSGWMNKIS